MSSTNGEDISLWVATSQKTNYPELGEDKTVYDSVVVGGGITGIALAYLLQKKGLQVALVEKGRIVQWTTGGTTAKLSSQHYLIYDYPTKRHGKEVAAAYAKADEDGINEIENLSKELGIDCDFSRHDAYVFSSDDSKTNDFKAEVAAAKELGLPASFEAQTDLPFDVTAAVKFSNQAQFHPRKFLLPLAEKFVKNGGVIYENTKAADIITGEDNTIATDKGELKAKTVVQASGEPFWNKSIFNDHMWLKMSYALAVKLKDENAYPKNMYVTTDKPMRTIRTVPTDDGKVMIFGGESHEYDDATYDEDLHYNKLIEDVHKRFEVDSVAYRWLAGDYMSYDRIPYIGPDPKHPSIYVITGYRAWVLAWAMSAAHAIAISMARQPIGPSASVQTA